MFQVVGHHGINLYVLFNNRVEPFFICLTGYFDFLFSEMAISVFCSFLYLVVSPSHLQVGIFMYSECESFINECVVNISSHSVTVSKCSHLLLLFLNNDWFLIKWHQNNCFVNLGKIQYIHTLYQQQSRSSTDVNVNKVSYKTIGRKHKIRVSKASETMTTDSEVIQ